MKIEKSAMTQSVNGKITREARKDFSELGKFTWWKADEKDVPLQIAATLNYIHRHDTQRQQRLIASTRLYGNSLAYSALGASFSRLAATNPSQATQRISFNVCSSIVDTLTAKIAKNEITPSFITSGGVWGKQKQAENLSKFVEGCFYENKAHLAIIEAFNDAAVWGDGLIHVYRSSKDRVAIERVVPHELICDPIETMVNEPRQLHRVKLVDRDILASMFEDEPEKIAMIMAANPANANEIGGIGTAADLVKVVESWHLPSAEGAKDGLHTICLENDLLFREEYEKDFFPFVHLRYMKRKFGHWGIGACERLEKIQGAINREMIRIDRSHYLAGSFKILVENSSKIVSQHLNNEIGAIIKYTNTPPQYITPPVIQPDSYAYVDSLIAKAYQQEGVSQLSASNLKPMGINSGAALRTYDQISDDRQLYIAKRVEDFALELAHQMIEVIRDIYATKGSYLVTWPGVTFTETVDWSDVNLTRDEYYLKAFPTSSLPDEPAAKLEQVQEYMQAGLISPRAGRRLLRMPDVEMADNLANAAEELIAKSIEAILYDKEKAENHRPDSEWDLQLCKQMALQYMNFAKLNKCPKAQLDQLREFMAYVDDELALTLPPPQPQLQPQANPVPVPQSPLIANVPGVMA